MKASKEFLKEKGIVPRISFKDKEKHIVELVKDKKEAITDENGEKKEGVKYLVKENGQLKSFFTASLSLIEKLAEFKPGSKVAIQMKTKKVGNDYINYFDVMEVKKEWKKKNNKKQKDEEVPIVDLDDLLIE